MRTRGWHDTVRRPAIFAAAALCAAPASAETAAGTAIVNVAELTRAAGGPVRSNASRIVVAERLDVALAAGAVAAGVDGSTAFAARLTNAGNGPEAFALTAAATGGPDAVVRIAVDGDGDGRYDPARDAPAADGRTPLLAAGQAAVLFVVVAPGAAGSVTLTAAAATGSGAPGTAFAGAGEGGGDAVVGATGARASVTTALAAAPGTEPSLTKSAEVAAPDGSARAVAGATITYTLRARFPAAVAGAAVTDPIPAGTGYVAGSLTLDDEPLGDADVAAGGTVRVALGDQPAGAVRTIRFKVLIQ